MATYKVLQDIEAEDKLLGPLTLKQFIFAIIFLACGYIAFLLLTRGLGFLSLFFVPPMLFTGFLAWPWSREQSTEVWLLAKVRFHIKPRRRIWNQSGLSDVVTITAPPKLDKTYTDGLSEGDVRSRLQALASTIDSRGWAIKNVNVNLSAGPGQATLNSDRLVDVSAFPQQVVSGEVSAADDILDERNNPTAQNLDRMINAKSATTRERIMKRLHDPKPEPKTPDQPPADYWFLNQPSGNPPAGKAMFDSSPTIRPNASDQISVDPVQTAAGPMPTSYANMHTIQPLGAAQPAAPVKPSPKTPDPAILELASNNDLNVATISRQAKKNKGELGDNEVVVPLR